VFPKKTPKMSRRNAENASSTVDVIVADIQSETYRLSLRTLTSFLEGHWRLAIATRTMYNVFEISTFNDLRT
jgi:hypothetical protein